MKKVRVFSVLAFLLLSMFLARPANATPFHHLLAYRGDIYQLFTCNGDTKYACPTSEEPPGVTEMQEDAPMFWCLEDGNGTCGPSISITREHGTTCIHYAKDDVVCQNITGRRYIPAA